MSDLAHVIGGDLTVAANGDLAAVSGSTLGQQRVLRRLLTNAGDYIWQLNYGAGLPAMIGTPADAAAITGIVRHQIFLENAVARMPAPAISVEAEGSILSLSITYNDAADATAQTVGATLSL
jgi:phage baseplate assembly protein W